MPRLSNFVSSASLGPTTTIGSTKADSNAASTCVQPQQQPNEHTEASIAKLRTLHERRLKEHGPRVFRLPDGSLTAARPTPNSYIVVRSHMQ